MSRLPQNFRPEWHYYVAQMAAGKPAPQVAHEARISHSTLRGYLTVMRIKYSARNNINLIHKLHTMKLLPRNSGGLVVSKPLTERELIIIAVLAEGFVQTEVARGLDLGIEVFKQSRKMALKKLHAINTPNLIHMAHMLGVLPASKDLLDRIAAAHVPSNTSMLPPTR